jgi:hypothetical protein
MVMSLNIKTTTYGASEDQSWLASDHGTQKADSITLDGANLGALFTTGFVPSGVPLKRVSGKYQACISTDVPEYFLFTSIDLTAGGTQAATSDSPAAGLWTCEVVASKVPAYTGKTSVVAANTTSGLFKFV